jgi:hypothetical protein
LAGFYSTVAHAKQNRLFQMTLPRKDVAKFTQVAIELVCFPIFARVSNN